MSHANYLPYNEIISTDIHSVRVAEQPITLGESQMSDYVFSQNDHSYTIVKWNGCGKHIYIPSHYNGLPITTIGKNAFVNQHDLITITIPEGVTTIEPRAFSFCSSLEVVNVARSVIKIGEEAFCTDCCLQRINIPGGVFEIESGAFLDCNSLCTVIIEDGVTAVGMCAFMGCHSLKHIFFPSSVNRFGSRVFCLSDLESITLNSLEPPVIENDDIFDSDMLPLNIFVPSQSIIKYKSSHQWKKYSHLINSL